jgi:hypothetical protein
MDKNKSIELIVERIEIIRFMVLQFEWFNSVTSFKVALLSCFNIQALIIQTVF